MITDYRLEKNEGAAPEERPYHRWDNDGMTCVVAGGLSSRRAEDCLYVAFSRSKDQFLRVLAIFVAPKRHCMADIQALCERLNCTIVFVNSRTTEYMMQVQPQSPRQDCVFKVSPMIIVVSLTSDDGVYHHATDAWLVPRTSSPFPMLPYPRKFYVAGKGSKAAQARKKEKKLVKKVVALDKAMAPPSRQRKAGKGNATSQVAAVIAQAYKSHGAKSVLQGHTPLPTLETALRYANVVADPGSAELVPCPDAMTGYVGIVRQHTEVAPSYINTGFTSGYTSFAGLITTGRLRDNYFQLTSTPAAASGLDGFGICELVKGPSDDLQEASTLYLSSQESTINQTSLPNVMNPGSNYPIPTRCGIWYNDAPTTTTAPPPAQLCMPSSIWTSAGVETLTADGTLVYPAVGGDKVQVLYTGTLPQYPTTPATSLVQFKTYNAAGVATATLTITYTGGTAQQTPLVANLGTSAAFAAGTVGIGSFSLVPTAGTGGLTAGQFTLENLSICICPLSSAGTANPNVPFGWWAGASSHDYSTLSNSVTAYRVIGLSSQFTDLTAELSRAGILGVTTCDNRSAPSEIGSGLSAFSTLSGLLSYEKTFQGEEKNGFYAVVRQTNVASKIFKPPSKPWAWEENFSMALVALPTAPTAGGAYGGRFLINSIVEVQTPSQLIPKIASYSDAAAYEMVMNALVMHPLVCENPLHMAKIGGFLRSVIGYARKAAGIASKAAPVLAMVPEIGPALAAGATGANTFLSGLDGLL